jgi:2,4-dienoyl-CoA reductase-like NADH-dependent reductase (Old Yellow Enzyme family)/thioredoxin reductase
MANRYAHLLSPFQVGNVVFRNRIFTAPMGLHALQGGELYPTDAIITHYANKAKGGAAVVTCSGTGAYPVTPDKDHLAYDLYIGHSQHYLAQLADAIHFYGAKASMEIQAATKDPAMHVVGGVTRPGPGLKPGEKTKEITKEVMEEIKQNLKDQVKILKRLGFDMCMLHMAYDMGLFGPFLNLRSNTRTDEYGPQSMENRVRLLNECCDAIHEAAGKDFLIELRMSGQLPEGSGFTIDDACEMAKLVEGHSDILHVHAGTGWEAHCMSFEPDTPNLWMAQRIKESGAKIPVLTIGGYQDLDEMEAAIADGKADLISMARGWLADPNLGTKAYEGRGEDVVPCVKCMRCHDSACIDGVTFVCTVNPVMGIEHKLEAIDKPATASKKVAIVGGGPAGMQAALTAAQRGHKVTLFEEKEVLGGQLNFADYAQFKHSLAKYKDWLIYQVGKSSVEVALGVKVTREMLVKGNYDVVIAALGAEPLILPIPGADTATPAPEVYGNEDQLGKTVVVIGGGQVGCETALHLVEKGHDVTVLEMQEKILVDASASYRNRLTRNMGYHDNLKTVTGGKCTGITPEGVAYTDKDGAAQVLPCDSVVMAAGMRPRQAAATALYDPAYRLYTVGDCDKAANVQKAVRAAFSAAISI